MKSLKKIIIAMFYIILIIVLCMIVIQKISNNKWSLLGYRIFRVVSESMIPEYNIGDVLLIKDIEFENIKKGDNISYLMERDSNIKIVVTHKVIDIKKELNGEFTFYTKGIANTVNDPEVKQEQVYGVVVEKIYLLSLFNKLINNKYGYIVLVFIPLLLIIVTNTKELINIVKEKRE